MGLYSFVLFAAIVLLACVGSASKVAAANSTAQGRWDAEKQNGASTKSFVRPSEPTDEGDEARLFIREANVRHKLAEELANKLTNLVTTANAWKSSDPMSDAIAYLTGPHGAQLAKAASQHRNMDSQVHDVFLGNLFHEFAVIPDKEDALVRALLLARHSNNAKIKTLATELLVKRIHLLLREEIAFDRSFVQLTSEGLSSIDKPHYTYLIDKYGDAAVTESLIKLKRDNAWSERAVLLQEELFERWLSGHKSVADVIELIKVKNNKYLHGKLDLLVKYSKLRQLEQTAEHSPGGLPTAMDADQAIAAVEGMKKKGTMKHDQDDDLMQDVSSP